MFDLEQWKKDWADNVQAWSDIATSEPYLEGLAHRCRNVERLLLLDLVQHLARLPTSPLDLFARPELVQLQEAARLVGG